jgi:hypothetical protein
MTTIAMTVCSVLFGLSVAYLIWFQVREGKDERGQFLLRRSYSLAYGVIVLGIVILLCVSDWSEPSILAEITIKDALFFILCASGITAGVSHKIAKHQF